MNSNIKVLLVYPNIWSEVFPLSVLTLSALLKQHDYEVRAFTALHYRRVNKPHGLMASEGVDDAVFTEFCNCVKEFQPDVIGLSVVEDAFPLACRLLDALQEFDGTVIMGGVFATFAPEKAIAHRRIDMICIGEGERPLLELCSRLQHDQSLRGIAGLWIRLADGTIEKTPPGEAIELDDLPTPDYSILDRQRFNGPMPLIPHRGCPYACTFCNSPSQSSLMDVTSGQRFFRKQSMSVLRRDLEVLITQYAGKLNQQGVYFCSDTLLAWSAREFDEFIELYADYKVPFVCHTTAETITADKIKKLVSVGLKLMNVGIQHGNEVFRREVLKRSTPNDELQMRFHIAADNGAVVSADFIMGFPLETPQLAQDTIDLSRRIRATARGCSLFVPYHGTALRALAVEKGYLQVDELAVWSPEQSQLDMPGFPRQAISRMMQEFDRTAPLLRQDWCHWPTA